MSTKSADITKDLVVKFIESALKAADPSLLQDVPLVGTLVKLHDLRKEFKRLLFEENVKTFLYCLNEIPNEEIASYVHKVETDTEFRTKVGRTVLELEKFDDARKAEYSARLFIGYLRGHLDEGPYQSLRFALERLHVPDVSELKDFYDNSQTEPSYRGQRTQNWGALQRLASCGLLTGPSTGLSAPLMYHLSESGKQFVELALDSDH